MSREAALAAVIHLLEDAMHQGCYLDNEGWLHTMGISTWRDLGDYLVEHADWERAPGGAGRIQEYRPPQQREGEA